MPDSLPHTADDPRQEYARRLEARQAAVLKLDRRHIRAGNWRLVVAIAAAVIAYLAFGRRMFSPWWLACPALLFIVLAVLHDRLIRERNRCARGVAYYQRALARLDNRWAGTGETGERFASKLHPYSEDLDLFGAGSLFELLCTARTRAGEQILADWLRAPAPPADVRARQAAVAELRLRLDLREDLAVLGEGVGTGLDPEALAAWGESAAASAWPRARITAITLCGLFVSSIVTWASWNPRAAVLAVIVRNLPLVLIVINGIFFLRMRGRAERIADAASHAARDLELFSEVLSRLEREQFAAPRLAELRASLDIEGDPPSHRIRSLRRRMAFVDSREHIVIRVIDPVLLWTVQSSFAVEAWRSRSGRSIGRWLAAAGEIEAFSSLAAYAYEHPADAFPEFLDGAAYFEARGLAHPLLAEDRAVRNDVTLGGEMRLIVVSGSNMSGKSTLLRSIGINAVLAQCGAPVRASQLRLSPLAVGASIRIMDSLQEGTSRFYTEITRLKQIVDLTAGPLPVLFLLDEFLQGTNSHDRRLGAEATVRGLIARGAIGLLTTHDLALAEIAEALGPSAANYHFEDRLENGKLYFDYRLRPGIVRRSNALELMRSVGLDV